MDALAEVVHRLQMLAPALVDDLQDEVPLDLAREIRPQRLLALGVRLERVLDELLRQRGAIGDVDLFPELLDGDVRPRERLHVRDEAVEIPVLGELGVGELGDARLDRLGDPVPHLVREVLSFEDAPALVVDHEPLRVHHVVVLEDVLARDEVLLLDLLLGVLDLLREDPRLHRLVVRDLEAIHDPVNPVAGEEPHQVVLRREVEARLARDRPGAPSGPAAGCRSAALRAARCRGRRARRRRRHPRRA